MVPPLRALAAILLLTTATPGFLAIVAAQDAPRAQKFALVIGNDSYEASALRNARNDARAMASTLTDLGFNVESALDVSFSDMDRAVQRFVERLGPGAIALVFYAGHGVQIDGENYLLPVDFAARDEAEAKSKAYPATRLYDRIAARSVGLQVLILDACRDNPFRSGRSASRGLAPMAPGQQGSLIAFSTAPGGIANDSPHTVNSVFTSELLTSIVEPGLSLEDLFLQVRQKVFRATKGRQIPWTNSSVLERFSFKPSPPGTAIVGTASGSADRESIFWEAASTSDSVVLLESYLQQYPQGRYVTVARAKLELLRDEASAKAPGTFQPRQSVAVAVFRNLTGRPAADWVGTALQESLRVELSLGENLRVVDVDALTRRFISTGDRTPLTSPDADITVSGSYLLLTPERGEPRVRINATVARRTSTAPVGTFSETAGEGELIELVSRLGARIRVVLKVPGRSGAQDAVLGAALPASSSASQLFAEAVQKLRRFDAAGASEDLLRATTQEPEFALGYARLAQSWALQGFGGRAREATDRARNLAAGLAREQRLQIDLEYYRVREEWTRAADIGRALMTLFPDEIDYAITLGDVQVSGGQAQSALAGLDTLRTASAAARSDPRVDLLEADASRSAGLYQRAAAAAQRAINVAIAQNAPLVAARARLTQAWALKRLGQLDESRVANEEARRLYSIAGDRSGMAAAALQLGSDLREQRQFEASAGRFAEALDLARAVGDRLRLAAALNNSASLEYDQGKLTDARTHYAQALDIFREVQDKGGTATALNNLATVAYDMGDPDAALPLDRESLQLRRELGAPRGIVISLLNMGESAIERLELNGAATMFEEARGLIGQMQPPDSRQLARVWQWMGTVQFWQGLFDDSQSSLAQAVEVWNGVRDADGAAAALGLRARSQAYAGACNEATATAQSAFSPTSLRPATRLAATAAALHAAACARVQPPAEAAAIVAAPPLDPIASGLTLARIEVALAQRDGRAARPLIEELRVSSKRTGSRLSLLLADAFDLEVQALTGEYSRPLFTDVQDRAIRGGVGFVLSRLQKLALQQRQ